MDSCGMYICSSWIDNCFFMPSEPQRSYQGDTNVIKKQEVKANSLPAQHNIKNTTHSLIQSDHSKLETKLIHRCIFKFLYEKPFNLDLQKIVISFKKSKMIIKKPLERHIHAVHISISFSFLETFYIMIIIIVIIIIMGIYLPIKHSCQPSWISRESPRF